MDAKERPAGDPLAGLQEAGASPRWSFRSLLAFIERLVPEAGRLGTAALPQDEAIRLRHDPSFAFSAADVTAVARSKVESPDGWGTERDIVEITTTFLGLTGSVSPLPFYISEEVLLEPADQPVRREFLDVFHHRLLSLLWRALCDGDHALEYRTGGRDEWSRRVLGLAGFDAYAESRSLPLPAWHLLRLAPLLVRRYRNAETIERVLQDVVDEIAAGARVRVIQFIGAWTPFDEKQRVSLGRRNHALGINTRIGSRVFDRTGKFRVQIGPVTIETYRRFRPGQDLFKIVESVIDFVLRDALDWDVELIIGAGLTPPMRLRAKAGARLGQESWLGTRLETERRAIVRREDETRS